MNGEMYQVCCIVAATKKALAENTTIQDIPLPYVQNITFQCLPQKRIFGKKTYQANCIADWFAHCKNKHLQDIKFLCPVTVAERKYLGFANTAKSSMVCFYPNDIVTFFTAVWEFDQVQKAWNVFYTEQVWENPPKEKPHFENNSKALQSILEQIRDFATQIECDYFAKVFDKAYHMLSQLKYEPVNQINPPIIPTEYLPIYAAAGMADVFGAMGSWNDEPPYMAHQKGLDDVYETLSNTLLQNIRLALLYVINEW